MIVVSDASPLIVLAKLNRLDLLESLFGTKITVLECVVNEILSKRAGIVERQRLESFLSRSAEVVVFQDSDIDSETLSSSDQFSLTYALRNRADLMIVDERSLRRVAARNQIVVVGVLGILQELARRKLITSSDAREDVRDCVKLHGLHVSVALYQRVMDELDRI